MIACTLVAVQIFGITVGRLPLRAFSQYEAHDVDLTNAPKPKTASFVPDGCQAILSRRGSAEIFFDAAKGRMRRRKAYRRKPQTVTRRNGHLPLACLEEAVCLVTAG
jgi:hypothetical protein